MDASAALVKVLSEEGPRALATLVRHRDRAEAAEERETAAALAPTEGERRLLLSRLLDVRSEPA
jgi:hypothetical protein